MEGGGRLRASLGALVERNYRLLFAATLVTSVGDAVALVALAFAVLDVTSASGLGLVIAVQQGASAGVLVFGGVLSDRMARNRVLVGASLLQGLAQAATAAVVLSDAASLPLFVAFAFLWGLGDGLIVPAETGLVPQTVSAMRLQQANALQGLSRGGVRVVGPALGGVLVVALSPGWALTVDSLDLQPSPPTRSHRPPTAHQSAEQPARVLHLADRPRVSPRKGARGRFSSNPARSNPLTLGL